MRGRLSALFCSLLLGGLVLAAAGIALRSAAATPLALEEFAFRRWVAVYNRAGVDLSDYPLEITSLDGTGFDHAALVAASKAQADGDDLRVVIDGVEVDRWVADPSTDHTKVWVNLDLAAPVTTSLTLAFDAGDSLTSIQVDDTTGFPSSGVLYLPDSAEAFVYTAKDATHFSGLTRAARGTAAAAGTSGDEILLIEHDMWLVYGNSQIGVPTVDDNYEPAFEIMTSTNYSWLYEEFGEDDGLRTASWYTGSTGGAPIFYGGNHASAADPWTDAGIQVTASNGSFATRNPCGFTHVDISGEAYAQYTGLLFARLHSSTDGSTWVHEYVIPQPSSSGTWDSWSYSSTLPSGSRYVRLYNLEGGFSPPPIQRVEIDDCTLSIDSSNTPFVELAPTEFGPGAAINAAEASTAGYGQVVTFTHLLTNTGLMTDTFSLTATGEWALVVLPLSATLSAGEGVMVYAQAQVSGQPLSGTTRATTVTATSSRYPPAVAQAVDLLRFELQPGADTDGDGIPDLVEGDEDDDGDGIPNYLDWVYLVYLPLVFRGWPPVYEIADGPDLCPGFAIEPGVHSYLEDFDHSNDNDWYQFDAVAGETYSINTYGLESRTDTVMYLYSTNCTTLLVENDDEGGGSVASSIDWQALSSGTYHIMIRSYDYRVWGADTAYKLQVR